LLPSVNGAVSNFISNGMSPRKLGIGIPFYGYVWTGTNITQPRQSWTNAPTVTQLAYSAIMADYYQSNLYHWDTNTQSAFLGITNSNPANNIFLSYDDQRTCQAKINYVRNHNLGGVIIWELAQGHQGGQSDPLMQALKQALATPGLSSLQSNSYNMNLTFSTIAPDSYHVQRSSDLSAGMWNTLLITNNSGLGGPLQITDAGVATNQPTHLYRVQTQP
jgi:hypothetical protein